MFSGAISVSRFGPGFVPISSCTAQDGGSLNCSLITDASCDHSMDLGVVCRTCEQLYNEFLNQCPSTNPQPNSPTCEDPTPCPIITCPTSTCPTVTPKSCDCPTREDPVTAYAAGATTIITALGAVTGVLVILLLGTVTALVVMCQKR